MAKTIALVPKRLDIKLKRGDTLSIPFVATDDSGAIDITGYEIVAQIRKKRLSEEATAQFVVAIENAALGLYSLVLSAVDSAEIPCGETPDASASRYLWDLQLKSPAGVVTTTHEGEFVISADVTRVA